MTNEDRAESITTKVLGGTHAQLEEEIIKAFTQVRNEALEEAVKVASQHESTDGQCPESIANAEGYRTAVSQIAQAIEALKDGAK